MFTQKIDKDKNERETERKYEEKRSVRKAR